MSLRSVLKSFFLTGSKPTQAQFADLIDSVSHLEESMADSTEIQNALSVQKYVNPAGLKEGVLQHAPVKSVKTINGNVMAGTGNVTIIPGQAKLFTFVKDEFLLPSPDTTLQPVFDSPMDEFAVGQSRTYTVKGKYLVLSGANSRQLRLGWSVTTDLMGSFTYTIRLSRASSASNVGTPNAVRLLNGVTTAAVSSTLTDPFVILEIDGVLRTNKDGIFKPLIQFSVASGDAVRILPGSYLELTDIGNASIDRSPGVS